MDKRRVVLKKGRDKAIRNRHHWIFSGAIEALPAFENGDILPVCSHDGNFLGQAYFNKKAAIIGRMIAFEERPAVEVLKELLDQAIALRKSLFNESETNAYRLVNGEGDFIPGLIVDKYDQALVFQITTMGMERFRPWLVDYFINALGPRLIYEKSEVPARKEEGLDDVQGVLYGNGDLNVDILENGLKFRVSLLEGQKTGFFLDHREMRQLIRSLSSEKKVLNCFCYTGGFSVYAMAGGALQVDSVDISEKAIDLAQFNIERQQMHGVSTQCIKEDVFRFLRDQPLPYDLVILDPPAFAKRKKDIVAGCRGYKDINRIALKKMPAGSILLTSSCSYHVDETLFQQVVFQASVEAGRNVRIIGRHQQAADHPINICHPESDYLKSLLLYVT